MPTSGNTSTATYRLCLSIYKLTLHFPYNERFSLTADLRNAARSACTGTEKRAALQEVQFNLRLACELDYVSSEDYRSLRESVEAARSALRD